MNISRRGFFKGLAAVAVLASSVGGAAKIVAKTVAKPFTKTITITGLVDGDQVRMWSVGRDGGLKEEWTGEITGPGEMTMGIDMADGPDQTGREIMSIRKGKVELFDPEPIWSPYIPVLRKPDANH